MADYDFTTTWKINAPIEVVWSEIYHSERWPDWWQGLKSVIELEPGNEDGVGRLRRYVWKGVLPHRLTVDIRISRIEPPLLLEGIVTGELEGIGRWQLSGSGNKTVVQFDWQVSGSKPWMHRFASTTRSLFRWNYQKLMEWGGQGLERRLATRFADTEDKSASF